MEHLVDLSGQWFGFYSYGEDYGEMIRDERVSFSFLIDVFKDRHFSGKCIELSGVGASDEVSTIEGFVENNFISFIKEYKKHLAIDDFGNEVKIELHQKTRISYEGDFDINLGKYSGCWEIEILDEGEIGLIISTGYWEMAKNSNLYLI